jgi:hypothetical protein
MVYPGANGAFDLYEDDGATFDYRSGEWMGIRMRWRDAERQLTLDLAPGSRMRPPMQRAVEVRVAGSTGAPRAVVFEGRPVEVRF